MLFDLTEDEAHALVMPYPISISYWHHLCSARKKITATLALEAVDAPGWVLRDGHWVPVRVLAAVPLEMKGGDNVRR